MSTSCLLQQQSAWPLKLPKNIRCFLFATDVCNRIVGPAWASTIALDMVVAMALALAQRCSLQLHMLRRFCSRHLAT